MGKSMDVFTCAADLLGLDHPAYPEKNLGSILDRSATRGHLEIKMEAPVNGPPGCPSSNPLENASQRGDEVVVRLLLDQGANTNLGVNDLEYAARGGYLGIV